MTPQAITLLQLNERISAAVASAGLSAVWVVAETSDVRVSGGHCYLELIDKDPDSGRALARMRAMIWKSACGRLCDKFAAATGMAFGSDMKVMVCLSIGFHPIYGMSATIVDINPEYTLGDLLRRRREMVERLRREGIIDLNRNLQWPAVPSRIAVISARGAAGYGDFINQLFTNRYHLRFDARLFEATLQGERAPASIIAALEAVAAEGIDSYDCVVIIRGGGATGDLAAFDDYALAANIALFPLPVIIGIGHERDITLLDYVANMRVKTPTAAAEWLIGRGADALGRLSALASEIAAAASQAAGNARRRLDYAAGRLPLLAEAVLRNAAQRVGPQVEEMLVTSVNTSLTRRRDRLASLAQLIDTISPEATLRRGFSITRDSLGRAITDTAAAVPGSKITTTLANGTIESTVILKP